MVKKIDRKDNLPVKYEKPAIIKHSVGLMNKFGRIPNTISYGKIDGVPINDLVEKFGSPLYVVSEGTIRRKYKEMFRAFSLRYPKVTIGYSYKTNYLSGVCAIMHDEGAWAEVVSGFEYEIASSLSVPGNQIIFNGPYKTKEELKKAIEAGSRVNIDSYEEMHTIEEIAEEMKKQVGIGVRINMELNYPPWDRFGFNLESGSAFDAVKRVQQSSNLKVVGIHIHAGTYISDVNIYAKMAEKLSNFCAKLQKELNIKLDYLDIGGGYASRNTLHNQWMSAELTCPSFDQYAEAICPALLKGPFKQKNMPMLILEPGRALVDEAVQMIASVVATKRLSNGGKGIVIDAGVNLVPTSWWYKHDILPAKEWTGITEEVAIFGPLCMQIDVIRHNVSLPPLVKGDILIIKNVGAYNFSQSMQFIQPRPAIVLVNEDKADYLRMPETMAYLKQLEKVPERLLKKKP